LCPVPVAGSRARQRTFIRLTIECPAWPPRRPLDDLKEPVAVCWSNDRCAEPVIDITELVDSPNPEEIVAFL